MARNWSVYEQNQLMKHGLLGTDLSKYGEMPVEYITGEAEFDGMVFLVNRDVLIPRVETVQLIDEAERFLKDRMTVNFAEIGTGCGAIGISLYKRLKKRNKEVWAVLSDVSPEALVTARVNLDTLVGKTDDISVIESDLLAKIDPGLMFDLIIANLPYIPSSRVNRLPESVAKFEPHLALDGGVHGLTLIKTLLKQAVGRVKPDGALILEMDYSHDIPDFVDVTDYQYEIITDEFGQNRFLFARPRLK